MSYAYKLAVLLWCASALLGCGEPRRVNNQDPKQATPDVEAIPSDAQITLRRTACYGTCPVYELTISADGRVVYNGVDHVRTKGKAEGRIGREELKRILSQFEKVGYFSLDDSYESGKSCRRYMTDMPSAITSLRLNGRLKTISHYYGCEGTETLQRLKELEGLIDEATNSKQWVE